MKTYVQLWQYLIMRNVLDKSCVEYQNTHFMLSSFFFFVKILHLWDNVKRYCTAREATNGNIIQHMHFACWIVKFTDTHSECVILFAFAQQQWLWCTSMLHLHVHCLFCSASFINHVWKECTIIYLLSISVVIMPIFDRICCTIAEVTLSDHTTNSWKNMS